MPSITADVSVQFDVEARMRDGAVLRADIYRPEQGGPWPTLLCRTPYGKRVLREIAWGGLHPVEAAAAGFMVVIQDTRGRFASEGSWQPLVNERRDGFDTIEWAARLPGSNGKVGTFGGSYCGNTQWMPAIDRPPSLAALSPLMTWRDPLDGLFARGGALELGLLLPWSLLTGADDPTATGRKQAGTGQGRDILYEFDRLADEGYWELPSEQMSALRRHGVIDLGSTRAMHDPSLASMSTVDMELTGAPPSFNTGGWYDIFLQGTLDNFQMIAAAHPDSRLIVGPWAHEAYNLPIGDLNFGLGANRDGVPVHVDGDWNQAQLAWFRDRLGGERTRDTTAQAPVRIFVMGRNQWRDESEWPPQRASAHRWYLQPDGGLHPGQPAASPSLRGLSFSYDPASPAPTVGGSVLMTPDARPGPIDQRELEARSDVLVFSSNPLSADLEVTGRVRVTLHVQSSAPSTDWVARLCDVYPDGRSMNICDGILRVENGANHCQSVVIDLWSTSNVFLRNHRLRIHVTSSSFPRWNRNLNTANQPATQGLVAHQEVFCDSDRPSFVELPVINS